MRLAVASWARAADRAVTFTCTRTRRPLARARRAARRAGGAISTHSVTVPSLTRRLTVGGVLEEEMDVHADGVAECACRLSGHERLAGAARRRRRAEERAQQQDGQKAAKGHDQPGELDLTVLEQMHVDEEGA